MLLKAELESYCYLKKVIIITTNGYQCSLKLNLNHTTLLRKGKNITSLVSMLLKAELESYSLVPHSKMYFSPRVSMLLKAELESYNDFLSFTLENRASINAP